MEYWMSLGAMTITGTYRSISWPKPFSCINLLQSLNTPRQNILLLSPFHC